MKRWLALSVCVALGACQEDEKVDLPTPDWEAVPDAPPLGPRYEDDDFMLQVSPATSCDNDSPLAPEAGIRRLSVPLEVRAKSAREIPVSPLSFTLEDEEGHRYRATLAGCAPVMKPVKLKRGETVKAEVSFDVPIKEKAFELIFEPFVVGRKEVRARTKLQPLP